MNTTTLKYGDITDVVLGVFYDVYNELGEGFLESVYHEAMAIALLDKGLQVEKQHPVPVYFRKQIVGEYRADLLVNGVLIVELKAVRSLEPPHEAQLQHYLRATSVEVGLLLNFDPKPQFRRLAFDNSRKKIRENLSLSAVNSNQ